MKVDPFVVDIPSEVLDDLHRRLQTTRWPDQVDGSHWEYGTNLSFMRELVSYWSSTYNWRMQEAAMNRLHHFVTTLEDLRIHFIHERGEGPRPLPILLSHGWPDSFLRMTKLIPRLTTPAAFGADPADSFDVVVPSIPGFGFSERPSSKGFWQKRVASIFAELMKGLGYTKYGAHGGDWGSTITEQIAFHHGGSLLGIHITDVPIWHMLQPPDGLTRTEEKYIEEGKNWQMEEGAYALLQATKPQTLAFAINDSPVGLAAWIIEKFRTWSDCGGDVESKFTKDELLNNVMIYWVSQAGGSSARLYYEAKNNWSLFTPSHVKTPTAFAMFPKDIRPAPREFAERLFNVEQWDHMPRGGHFAALEEPDLLADSIRRFYRRFR